MHFTIDQEDATIIFRLKEARLDSANASSLKAEFLILAQPDVESLIVDLSEVQYVDSAGLSALLLAQRQQSAHGGDVRLVGASESVQSLLRLTQLDRVLPQFTTLEEAMNVETYSELDEHLDGNSAKAGGMSAAKVGALAAGGSLGAAALAAIMMGHAEDPDALDGDDDLDDDDFDDDDFADEDLDDDDESDDDDDEEDADDFIEGDVEPAEGDIAKENVDDLDDDFDDDDDDDDDDDFDDDIL